jgi:urease gamma subunit
MEGAARKLNQRDEEAIVAALRAGASPHMIARNWKLTMPEAVALSEAVANEVKDGGASHRVLIRGLLREQASQAVRTVREIMDGTRIDAEGNRVNILATKEGREIANVRLKAAESIMRMASRFIDEDVVRGYMEQPQNPELQETLFDFDSQVRDDGSTVLVAKPSLKLVGAEA